MGAAFSWTLPFSGSRALFASAYWVDIGSASLIEEGVLAMISRGYDTYRRRTPVGFQTLSSHNALVTESTSSPTTRSVFVKKATAPSL